MWAAGVGGPITGRGADLGMIDDPLKNAKEAQSETIRKAHKEWYDSTFYTRLEPMAAVMVTQTRWNEDDLSGYLLSQESEEAENWHIINLEAIKESVQITVPSTCTLAKDWRAEGEALCPERYDAERLNKIKRRVGSYFWAALYQQRPAPIEGAMLKRNWWQYYTIAPDRFDRVIQSWDMSFKDTDGSDFVVGQVWGRVGARAYLLDQVRDRMDFPTTCEAVKQLTAKWPNARLKLVEDKANGPAVIASLQHAVPGMVGVEPDGGKVARASACSPLIEAKNVYLPDPSIAPWVGDFVQECSAFPNGAHDDQVDACTQALNRLYPGAKDPKPDPGDVDPHDPDILKHMSNQTLGQAKAEQKKRQQRLLRMAGGL
jgi:predicted phage terminase large subunit-like protein